MNTFKRVVMCTALAGISTLSACVVYRGHTPYHDHDRDQHQERHHDRDRHDRDSDDGHYGGSHDHQ